jgi:hypothetical protein
LLKFVGRFRVFQEITLDDGEPTSNKYDNYIKFRTGQIYRYNKNTLALLLNTSHAKSTIIPELENLGVNFTIALDGTQEGIFHFSETQLDTVVSVVKPMTKGRNISPRSKRTTNRLKKELDKKK